MTPIGQLNGEGDWGVYFQCMSGIERHYGIWEVDRILNYLV